MRLLICGDREWTNIELIGEVLDLLNEKPEVVIEGEQRGADLLGRLCAEIRGIAVEPYPADWNRFGNGAGPIRNQQMLVEGEPDLVLAFHNDIENSSGTKDMIKRAEQAGIPVILVSENTIVKRPTKGFNI